MGQYFKAVNLDKKEVICPWCLHTGAKLWEWAANPLGAVFTLLLRRSSGSGGGDFYGGKTRTIELGERSPKDLAQIVSEGVLAEGVPVDPPEDTLVGRWAADRVYLVGDYDESGVYEEAKRFRNISEQLAEQWNGFIELEEMQLRFDPCGSCTESDQ